MLPKQLESIKNYLSNKKSLTKEQVQLLNELEFLEQSAIVNKVFNSYSYKETLKESFVVASGTCPNCGKKY